MPSPSFQRWKACPARRALRRPGLGAALVCAGVLLVACTPRPPGQAPTVPSPTVVIATPAPPPTATPPPTVIPSPATVAIEGLVSDGLETHTGLGYALSYPIAAKVVPHEISPRMDGVLEWTEILGPVATLCTMLANGATAGQTAPAYWLHIMVYANPEGLDAETWARRDLLDTWRRATAEGQPLGGAPVDDGVIREDCVGQTVVAGRPAFWITYPGGDESQDIAYYLASGEYIVTLRLEVRPELDYMPLAEAQNHAAYLLMSTLRLE